VPFRINESDEVTEQGCTDLHAIGGLREFHDCENLCTGVEESD
jgi:hypothetical protein